MVVCLPCIHKCKALAFILSKRKERYIEQKSSVLVTRKFQDPFGGILVSLIKQFKNRHRGCSRTRQLISADRLAFERKTRGQAIWRSVASGGRGWRRGRGKVMSFPAQIQERQRVLQRGRNGRGGRRERLFRGSQRAGNTKIIPQSVSSFVHFCMLWFLK